MLQTYLNATQNLLQNPSAPVALYSAQNLTTYINTARGQVAGEGRCVRRIGLLQLVRGQQEYNFSAIAIQNGTGVAGVINVSQGMLGIAQGYRWMRPRAFTWMTLYRLNDVVPKVGPPNEWAVFGQGAAPQAGLQAAGGSLYVSPAPDQNYTMWLDCVCYPVPLVDDTTPEVVPFLWSDSISYFAAYLALLSAQSQARQADADRMMQRYSEFANRARNFSNPEVLQGIYSQSPNQVRQNQLGVSPRGGGA